MTNEEEIDPAVVAKLQHEWDLGMRELFLAMARKFKPGSRLTVICSNPTIQGSEWCWSQEPMPGGYERIRQLVDVLEERDKSREITIDTPLIDLNVVNVKVEQE